MAGLVPCWLVGCLSGPQVADNISYPLAAGFPSTFEKVPWQPPRPAPPHRALNFTGEDFEYCWLGSMKMSRTAPLRTLPFTGRVYVAEQ